MCLHAGEGRAVTYHWIADPDKGCCNIKDCTGKPAYFEVLTKLLFCPDHWKSHERGEDYQ